MLTQWTFDNQPRSSVPVTCGIAATVTRAAYATTSQWHRYATVKQVLSAGNCKSNILLKMKDLRLHTTIVTEAKLRKYTTRVTLDILETNSLKTKPKRRSMHPAPVNAVTRIKQSNNVIYVCDPREWRAAWRYLFKPSHSHRLEATMTFWFTGKLHMAQAVLYNMIKRWPITVDRSTCINIQGAPKHFCT